MCFQILGFACSFIEKLVRCSQPDSGLFVLEIMCFFFFSLSTDPSDFEKEIRSN